MEPAVATPPLYGIVHRDPSALKDDCGYHGLCGGYEVVFFLSLLSDLGLVVCLLALLMGTSAEHRPRAAERAETSQRYDAGDVGTTPGRAQTVVVAKG